MLMSAEHEITVLITERDYLEQMCDKLAARIAPPHVLGDHSSDNDPWFNALNYGDSTGWDNLPKDEVEALEEAALAEAEALSADPRKVGAGMTVPDEAVGAAIVAVVREFAISQEGEYDATAIWGTPEEVIRHALTAAAPLIAAQAWDEGHESGFQNAAYGTAENFYTNPYRSGT